MKHILKTTDMRRYTYIAADGTEPLRNYRKTVSLLQSRLHDTYPDFSDILATPNLQSDGNIEWTTDRFDTLPRPLSALQGDERAHYAAMLGKSMSRLKKALTSLPASSDVAELHAIATVPSESTIYCADDRIVIAEWGLRPVSGVSALSLLSFADTVAEKPKPASKPEPENKPEPEKPVAEPRQPKVEENNSAAVAPHTPEPPTVAPAVTPAVPPVTPAPPMTQTADSRPKKKSRAWLWILLAILGVAAIVALILMLTRCSSPETVATLPATSPEISKENIVLTDDSMAYVVNNRLNIMVVDGGTLDEFIKDFRKEFPDKKKYALSSPDTVVNHVLLTLPPEEVKEMSRLIPEKMKPKYRVIVAPESLGIGNYVPSDPAMTDSRESYYFDMINAPEAWDIQKGDPNMIVAVLDDGFDMSHPEIKDKITAPYDIYRNKPGTIASQSGHGQHTSATAVGTADNNSGACGVAPDCKVMPVNVFTPQGAPDSLIIKGMIYAAQHGAKVLSISIGRYFGPQAKFLPVEQQKMIASQILPEVAEMYDEVYRILDEMGVNVVLAAGNETIIAEMDPMNRSQYPVVVSAVDPDCNLAIFNPMNLDGTNWGDRCDISAPGVNIYNAIPGGYDYMSGTSMSCPQVAGGVALVRSQHPELTPQEAKKVLVATAVPVDDPVGPLMDLAAALNADPKNLPENPGKTPSQSEPGRGGREPRYTDPYEFFFSQMPTPSPRPTPGTDPSQRPTPPGGYTPTPERPTPSLNPMDCEEAARELQKLQHQYEALMKRYGACL